MPGHSLPTIAEVLQAHGLRTQKKFGQHFLFDLNLTEKIVRMSGVKTNDLVFEIGPGPGGLTRALLMAGANVFAIEADTRFEPVLQQIQTHFESGLNWVFSDALQVSLEDLSKGKPYSIIANLPYNVGTALLVQWLTGKNPGWTSMTLMFQLEVAKRIIAKAKSPHYGRLSILTGAVATAKQIMHVPASAFTPPPKVESAIVQITPLPVSERFEQLQTLSHITALAFGQRRKMLRASLKPLSIDLDVNISNWLTELDIDPTARPETLTPAKFMQMAKKLAETKS